MYICMKCLDCSGLGEVRVDGDGPIVCTECMSCDNFSSEYCTQCNSDGEEVSGLKTCNDCQGKGWL